MPFPSGLRALNHADFRRFFLAQFLTLVCGWMHTVAQSWLVLQLTDSPFRLGLLGTLQFTILHLLLHTERRRKNESNYSSCRSVFTNPMVTLASNRHLVM